MISMGLSYAVAIVLPIVGTFFLGFGILEDSGYLPRLAVMVDRLFKKIGCNGKAVLPMILGLGCDTMATLTTRILETRRERVIVTLLLALGVPCSAQLGVILGMLSDVGPVATITWVGLMVAIILAVGFLASKVIPGESSDFILEIPPIRWPQVGNLAVKTMARIEWYLAGGRPPFPRRHPRPFHRGPAGLAAADPGRGGTGDRPSARPAAEDDRGVPDRLPSPGLRGGGTVPHGEGRGCSPTSRWW